MKYTLITSFAVVLTYGSILYLHHDGVDVFLITLLALACAHLGFVFNMEASQ
jgi:hypothetical protein